MLFRLSQCLAYSGRFAEARPPLGRLQAEFPQSPFVEEAKRLEATFPAPGVPAVTAPAPAGPPPQDKPTSPPQNGPPPGRD